MAKPEPVRHNPFKFGDVTDFVSSTPAQREIWSASQLGTEASCSYNQVVRIELDGRVDEDRFRAAVKLTVAQHEALRGSFSDNGQLFSILSSARVPVEFRSIENLDSTNQALELRRVESDCAHSPFDLNNPPLVRLVVLSAGPGKTYIIICAHHIIADGWSMGVILTSLSETYGQIMGKAKSSDIAALGFCNFVRWYNGTDQRQRHSDSLEYWKSVYRDKVPVLDLPLDGSRSAQRSFSSDSFEKSIDGALVAGFKKSIAKYRSTFSSGALAAFAVLLHKVTGQDDFVIGVPAAGQSQIGETMLVGHCTNLLPVRVQLTNCRTFVEILERCRSAMLDAMQYQYCSYTELLPLLRIRRDPSRPTLVPVMFNVDRVLGEIEFGGIPSAIKAAPREYDIFEWTVNIVETNSDARLEVTYNQALFERDSIRRRADEFEALLSQVTASPEVLLSELSLLSESSRRRQVTEWNATS
ncbi:MAG: condensation domain-containing protein, partial [Gammaproteobacteria bacterium]|nr:condensation domain-containing protein [Gammaproteobacteria bacterium]